MATLPSVANTSPRFKTPPRRPTQVVEITDDDSDPKDLEFWKSIFDSRDAAGPVVPQPQANFYKTQSTSTPGGHSSQNTMAKECDIKDLQKIMALELGKKVFVDGSDWAEKLYESTADDEKIDAFLKKETSGYSVEHERWMGVPETPKSEEELYAPLMAIVSNILGDSDLSSNGQTRTLHDTHGTFLQHDNKYHSTKPDFSITGTGSPFTLPVADSANQPQVAMGVGYTNMTSFIEVKLDQEKDRVTSLGKQIAVYGRQFFIQQKNRNFVRCLVLTNETVRLAHFDRSGLCFSQDFNIHEYPQVFVRLILGVTSPDEKVLGFDTTVKWESDGQERTSGTVRARDGAGNLVDYKLDMSIPPFVRPSIRGRGTTCWYASHPDTGERVLIKDSWRSAGREREDHFLDLALGLPGVVQYQSFQDECAQTMSYGPTLRSQFENFTNRIKSRVVMHRYGPSIDKFKTRYEAIAALRDALAGHWGLYNERGVLHRDISLMNILLGTSQDPVGDRGILIDLDMAIDIRRSISDMCLDPRTGPRRYQSVSVIENSSKLQALNRLPHDYLDDLESFYWVLCDLLFSFAGPGKYDPEVCSKWDGGTNAGGVVSSKYEALTRPFDDPVCTKWWGEACVELLENVQSVVQEVFQKKDRILRSRKLTNDGKVTELTALGAKTSKFVDRVLAAFDEALAVIEQEDADDPERLSEAADSYLPPSSPLAPNNVDARGKRRLSRDAGDDDSEGETTPKRARRFRDNTRMKLPALKLSTVEESEEDSDDD